MKTIRAIVCILLAFVMMLGTVACGDKVPAPQPNIPSAVTTTKPATTTEPEGTTVAPDDEDDDLFSLEDLAQARIIYPAETTVDADRGHGVGYLFEAILLLQNMIKNKHKCNLPTYPDITTAPATYEILIGDTNRPESSAIFSDLLLNDYGYALYENKIVIKGGSDSALKNAINAFVSSIVSANVGGRKFFFSHQYDYVYQASYAAKGLTLNGAPIGTYRIVYPANATMYEKALSERLSNHLATVTGSRLPFVDDSTPYVPGTREILLGRTNRSFQIQTTEGAALEADSTFIAIVGSNAYEYGLAQQAFMDFLQAEALTSKKSEITYAAKTAVSDNDKISVMGYNIYGVNGTIYQLRADNICRKVTKYLPGIVSFQEPAKNLMDLIHMEQYYGYYLGIPRHTEDAPIVAGSVTIDGVVHQLNGANSYAPILYAKDRYEVVEGGTKWLTSTPDDYSRHPDSDYARIYTYVLFHDKTTDESFIVVNHHLDTNDDIQYETMKYMYKYFNENYTDIPVIMAGDMNATSESEVMKDLILTEAGGFESLHTMSPKIGKGNVRIDWILATSCCVTGVYFTTCEDTYRDYKDARFDNKMPSDHHATYAEMLIHSKNACTHDWTEAASGVFWATET